MRQHESHGVLELAVVRLSDSRKAAARHSQTLVIVVVVKAGFSAPHREGRTPFHPALKNTADIQVEILLEAFGVFPVLSKQEGADRVRREFALDARESRVKDGVLNDVEAGAMVLVKAALPMSDDEGRLIFPDGITNGQARFFVVGKLPIRVGKK